MKIDWSKVIIYIIKLVLAAIAAGAGAGTALHICA